MHTRDKHHIWYPCTQMHDFEQTPPLLVTGAKGSYLHTPQGPVIDATSSWWCKPLGHQHPRITCAIEKQLHSFEHVLPANTTHPNLMLLGEKLAELSQLPHVFFASDGSSAVEIAMKLAIHAKQGSPQTHFLALQHSYHGETLATLSVSDLGLYKAPYQHHTLPCHFISSVPYTSTPHSFDARAAWAKTLAELEPIKHTLCALLFEPLVQGAGGMHLYSADYLRLLVTWAQSNNIYCIADEIMTGFCRTGTWFASTQAHIQPDLICVSKGLTGGALPLSAVLISEALYDHFYHPYAAGKNFLHSHTHSGNALAIAAALGTLSALEDEDINTQALALQPHLRRGFEAIQTQTGKLTSIRGIGGIIAADLTPDGNPRLGFRVYQEALKRNVLLRPLGNTLYWLPPLNTSIETIEALTEKTYQAVEAAYKQTITQEILTQ